MSKDVDHLAYDYGSVYKAGNCSSILIGEQV